MDLNLLAVFDAVAHASSFSVAARRLGMPKSSVSRGLARLEEELGVQLVFRTTRQVSLSPAGAALHRRIAPLLGSVRTAVRELPELEEEPSGRLRVTAPVDLGVLFLAGVVTRYAARYPGVSVDLHLTGRVVDLVAEGFDIALRIGPALRDSSLLARKAARVTSQLFAAPAYLARRGTPHTEEDLSAHEWVFFRSAPKALRLEGPRGEVELAPRGRIVCDDLLFVRDAVRSGAGIGLLPTFVAEPDVAAGGLVRILPRHSLGMGSLFIVSPAARHQPRKVAAFRDLLLDLLRSRPFSPAEAG